MIIWDKANFELVGGQRFLFNQKGSLKTKLIPTLKNIIKELMKTKNFSFCEIGRTS